MLFQKSEPCGQRLLFDFEKRRARSADAAYCRTLIGQALVGIIGTQRQTIFCPLREHPVGLLGAQINQIINHDTDVGVSAVQNKAMRGPAG